MAEKRRRSRRQWLTLLVLAGLFLCVALAAISALMNLNLPRQSAVPDRLSEPEKARLAEFYHLKQTLGDKAWPGWGTADIPVILYNEEYAFLVNYPDPPDGWIKVPQNESRGGPWQPVPGDTFDGRVYYRQPLPASGQTPEAFTVQVGERWVASMQTMEWMKIALANQFREDLPPVVEQIFPYRLVTGLFLGSSDMYLTLVAHESFHAYQGTVAAERLAAAETAVRQESRYPWHQAGLEDAWQTELDLLADALKADSAEETAELARQFLAQRRQRRQELGLAPDLVDYERQREWLEGLARYLELEIWQQAAITTDYEPVSALARDPEFEDYETFDERWSQEVGQLTRMAGDEGSGRFYYSGMAQAVLLDRLVPGWKAQAMEDGVFLEALLLLQ